MQLPKEFEVQMRELLGDSEYEQFETALNSPTPVSIRINPSKQVRIDILEQGNPVQVPWCENGYYLSQRPSFTMDPLFHAGAYYVQEASSMYISHLIKSYVQTPVCALDLCAAPGGKSTLLLSDLPQGSFLISNEINRKRASILVENISKWIVEDNCIVTNNEAKDFKKVCDDSFDLILCDVPCSGEGMFRKDEKSIEEWSINNTKMCSKCQREIVEDIWRCLKPGGLLIYSTCTYNKLEDEENVSWIANELEAEILDCNKKPEWNISGNLLDNKAFSCCHFLQHKTVGEGFFCAILRKSPENPETTVTDVTKLRKKIKGKLKELELNPISLNTSQYKYEADEVTALKYLHGEAMVLPSDLPKGEVTITYKNLPLGLVKNIGSRANNLYPKEWRIKKSI